MPFRLGIDQSQNLRWVEYSGIVTMSLVQSAQELMTTQPGWTPGLDIFVHAQKITDIDLDFMNMMTIAGFSFRGNDNLKPAKMAIFYASEHHYGMGRILASAVQSTQNAEVELFQDEAKAFKWLERSCQSLDALRTPDSLDNDLPLKSNIV